MDTDIDRLIYRLCDAWGEVTMELADMTPEAAAEALAKSPWSEDVQRLLLDDAAQQRAAIAEDEAEDRKERDDEVS